MRFECLVRKEVVSSKNSPFRISSHLSIKHFLEEKMKKTILFVSLMAVAALVLSACGGGAPTADNLLDDIKNRGYIMVSTDPNYEPQSFLNTEGKRLDNTKCPTDALTTAEMQGFDVDVAIAVGDGLGVETCFATPDWDLLTAGNWVDKWDISVGSMTITPDRQKVLDFITPYYGTPAVFAVSADSSLESIDELAGQPVCVGLSTTYEIWLNGGDLGPGVVLIEEMPADVQVVPLSTDQECAQALAAGRQDFVAYLTSQTVINANIAEGLPVKQLGTVVFTESLAACFDRASTLDSTSLQAAVDDIIIGMHKDGTLSALSMKWFGEDLTLGFVE
jgi:polar amino acid transport system substrate-binding protein